MHKLLLTCSLLMVLGVIAPSAHAAPDKAAADGTFSCPALREEKSYSESNKDVQFLLPGKDGWFYRSVQDLRTDYSFRHENGDLLVSFNNVLKSKGIELILVYPPTRGVAAHQFVPVKDPLAKRYNAAMVRMNYKKMLADMKKEGVHIAGTPDVKLGSKFFFRADHHWTVEGAEEMAHMVADYVKTLPLYDGLKKTEFVTTALPPVDNEPTFNAAIKEICGKGVPVDKLTLTETAPAEKGDANSLLGDANAEFVLVGTSNSKRTENDLNFSGRLKEFLAADVLNAAITGSGITESIATYLASSHYKETPPKVIIWEIPGYYDLDGGSWRTGFRQLIASSYRQCDKPLVEAKAVKLSAKTADVLQGKAKDLQADTPYYFGIKLDKNIGKKLTLTFKFDKGEQEVFEAKQLRSYPEDLSFFYAPRVPSGARLVSVEVDGGAGAVADASLCAFPSQAK